MSIAFFSVNDVSAATEIVHDAAELQDKFANSTEDSVLKLASDFTATGRVDLTKNSTFMIEIDGADVTVKNRFRIASNDGGTVTFSKMNFDGETTTSVGIDITNSVGDVAIKDSIFQNSRDAGVIISGTGGAVTVDNTLFKKNMGAGGGGITLSGGRNLTVKSSSFVENINQSAGYYGGAISGKQYSGHFIIENSRFIENKAIGLGTVLAGGGAIYMYQNTETSVFEMNQSYFEGNETELNTLANENLDGGAVVVFDYPPGAVVKINQSTFYNNSAGDDGGALLLQAKGINNTTYITNSTFYKNTAKGQGSNVGASGGAIQLFGNRVGFSGGIEVHSTNNTFYMNGSLARVENQEQQGGAIAASSFTKKSFFESDLLLGNFVEKNGEVLDESMKKNMSVNGTSVATNSLGFDNGKAIVEIPEEAYGKLPVVFGANQSVIKAGYADDEAVVPTLPILPKFINSEAVVTAGIANEAGAGEETVDQRGYERLGKKDIGAVEIASTLYDANGGKFNVEALEEYDGTKYYEGTTPTQYATVGTPGYTSTIIDGAEALGASYEKRIFLGWSTNKSAKLPDRKYDAKTKHKVDDQLVLYAVWKEQKVVFRYAGNGNTTGVAPTQKSVSEGAEVTIKKQGTLKKSGYEFAGWSTKATAAKADSKLAPTKKVKVVKKTTLYAVWKR